MEVFRNLGEATNDFSVFSEVNQLTTVLVHEPGKEIEKVTANNQEDMLFDGVLPLKLAQQQHEAFVKALDDNGVRNILYLRKELADILSSGKTRYPESANLIWRKAKQLLEKVLKAEATSAGKPMIDERKRFVLVEEEVKEKKDKYIERKKREERINDLDELRVGVFLNDLFGGYEVNGHYIIRPKPNLFFTRDPGAVIGNLAVICNMAKHARSGEPKILEFFLKERFKNGNVFSIQDDQGFCTAEGGDFLVLNDSTLAIGTGERTNFWRVDSFIDRLIVRLWRNLGKEEETFENVIVVPLPQKRDYMHLDTVLTVIDEDKCLCYPKIVQNLKAIVYKREDFAKDIVARSRPELCSLIELLTNKGKLGMSFELVPIVGDMSGERIHILRQREQHLHGTNVLAVRPGVVISYDLNFYTNRYLKKVLREPPEEIPGSELARAGGGPHCMSFPLKRERK